MGSFWFNFLVIFLAMAIWGALHTWLASLGLKAQLRRLNLDSDRWYRLAYNIFSMVTLLPVLLLAWLLPDQPLYRVPAPWSYLMLAIQAASAILGWIAIRQTGAGALIGIPQSLGKQPARLRLVTTGLYRWVRHPIYVAGLVFLWATPRMSANLLALYVAFSLYFIAGAHVEERKLREVFGEAYATYQRRVPMWVPGLGKKEVGRVERAG